MVSGLYNLAGVRTFGPHRCILPSWPDRSDLIISFPNKEATHREPIFSSTGVTSMMSGNDDLQKDKKKRKKSKHTGLQSAKECLGALSY